MLVIGLTGGIGSGKSTVAREFKELGVPVANADELSHELTQQNTDYYLKIVQHFGATILNENNDIDRKKLREIVFSNPKEKAWLEQLLHPPIFEKLNTFIKKSKNAYCLLEIPLLLEAQYKFPVDRVLIVDVSEELQQKRTQQRSKLTSAQVVEIIKHQISRADRLKHANDIIDNSGSEIELKEKVLALHHFYLDLARNKT